MPYKDVEKRKECARKWARAHRPVLSDLQKEKAREVSRKHYLDNKARVHKRNRDWVKAHPDVMKKRGRKYRGLPAATRLEPPLCECCGGPPNAGKAMCLDHCHISGTFRGWLCFNCNTSIGKLGDSIEGLMKAVRYLQRAAGEVHE